MMGLFGGIKNTYKKSEAAIVVQNLLDIQAKAGMFDADPASTATRLIDAAWSNNPHLFDGSGGERPHKLSVAAFSLAIALDGLHDRDPSAVAFALSLGKILEEVTVNVHLYPINGSDLVLTGAAMKVYGAYHKRVMQTPLGREVDQILDAGKLGWDEWFAIFKEEAAKHNKGLSINEKGFSLADVLEDEPLKRAWQDGVDPRFMGKDFAERFDPSTFL